MSTHALYRDNIVLSIIEIYVRDTCRSVDKLMCFWNLQLKVEIYR